jgi:DNA processing protein
MLNKNLILHLTLIEDIGSGTIQKIMLLLRQGFEGYKRSDVQTSDLYALSQSDWMNYFGFSENTAAKISAGLADQKLLEKELNLIEQNKIQWITILDEIYPQLLREIYLPPIVLYMQGADIFSTKCIAVVGARKANEYGQRIITTLIPDFVAAGYTIVSGGALGIDTMAHEAALKCGGKTIAILGSGLLRLYPSQNKSLFKRIIESGGIVASSFPLTMDSLPGNFPARNRIVTGLSRGCLVVQAAQKSGALISAHYAMEQGREVFAVPGNFDDELSAGCNALIQQGAKLVMNSADIFNEFGDRISMPDRQQLIFQAATVETQKTPVQIYSEIQQKIMTACKRSMSLEDIAMITKLSFEQVQSELFNLQIDGVVEQDFTGMWASIK